MVNAWTLSDPVEGTVYTFPFNPNAGSSPPRQRPLTNAATTAPDGVTIVFQGEPVLPLAEFSGVLGDYASYQAMITWTSKQRMLALVDDLGRISWIIFTQFTAQRSPRHNARERRTYTCRYQVVG
jgi:hypothetical protein